MMLLDVAMVCIDQIAIDSDRMPDETMQMIASNATLVLLFGSDRS
jgi:hypothetical protein